MMNVNHAVYTEADTSDCDKSATGGSLSWRDADETFVEADKGEGASWAALSNVELYIF